MARKAEIGKRENIIAAGITVFARKGFSGTRIAEVAKAAGIGKGTIYEYFRSKEELFFATFEHLISDTVGQLTALTRQTAGSASNRLAAMADTMIQSWLENLDIYGLVLEYWSATTAQSDKNRFKEIFQSVYSQGRRVVAGLIDDGIRTGEFKPAIDSEKIASALIGSWDALLLQAWLDPGFDPAGASRSHMQIVVAGLKQSTIDEVSQ